MKEGQVRRLLQENNLKSLNESLNVRPKRKEVINDEYSGG